MKPIELTVENFDAEVLNSSIPVLVDFWAPWCGPCRMMAPVLDDLAVEFEGKIKISKMDVDNAANQELAQKYNISSIPNLKLFKNGQVIKDYVGFREKGTFATELNEAIK